MARIVVLPGVCGSGIDLDRYIATVGYWMNPGLCALQGPLPLSLNSDGTAPLPQPGVRAQVVTGPLTSYYGRLVDFFRQLGHQVYPAGYDWRLGVRQVASGLWSRIRAWAGNDPVYLVGHSLGGMVGRGLLRVATEAGQGEQIARLVTLGTPQLGSLSIPRLWARLGAFYFDLGLLFYTSGAVTNAIRTAGGPLEILDRVVGTLVSTYSLLPQPGSPVFGGGFDYAACMNRNTYVGFNGWTLQPRFDAARIEHAWLQGAVYPAQQISVIGTGLQTPYGVVDVAKIGKVGGYAVAFEGDGTVDVPSATLPGVPSVTVTGVEHQAFPYDPVVLPLLPNLLLTGRV